MKLSVVILPAKRWSEASAMWRRADEYGLHAAYTYDHLSWRTFRDKAWFTMIPTLTAAAGVTTSLRLGPLVTTPNFRHPLLLCKDLLALDDVSGGRISSRWATCLDPSTRWSTRDRSLGPSNFLDRPST